MYTYSVARLTVILTRELFLYGCRVEFIPIGIHNLENPLDSATLCG